MRAPRKSTTRKPDGHLKSLLDQPGGVDRDDAVSAAVASVNALREECIDGIEAAFKQIETIARSALNEELTDEQLREVLNLTDRIITLAGTYNFDLLGTVARSLGDLANLLMNRPRRPSGVILVHIHAAQLFSPRTEPPPAEQARGLLLELEKVIGHFDDSRYFVRDA